MIDNIKNEDLRRLFALSTEMFAVIGYDGYFKILNPAWEACLGYTIEELLSKPVTEFIHPDDLEVKGFETGSISPDGEAPSFINRYKCKDGSYKWLLWIAESYCEEKMVFAAARDVTNYKKIEKSLRESEARYRLIVEGSQDIFFYECSEDGRIRYISPSVKNVTGYDPKELAGRMLKEFEADISTDTAPSNECNGADIPEKSSRAAVNRTINHKDGRRIILDITESAITDSNGSRQLIGFAKDITERILSEKSLQESQRRMSTLVKNLPGMAYRLRMDRDWVMEYVSEGAYALTGYHPDELIRKYNVAMGSVIHHDDIYEAFEKIYTAVSNGVPFTIYYRIVTAEGKLKWVWEQGQGIYSSDGQLEAIEGFTTDVSYYKNAEEEQKRLNRALKAITQVNQIIIRATDELTFLNDVLDIICNIEGYRMAWVGYLENDAEKLIRPAAWKGYEDGYLKHVKLSWGNNYFGQGPTGIAVRTKKPAMLHNIERDLPSPQLRQTCLERGYMSIYAAPLMENQVPFGVLVIYGDKADLFNSEEKSLLEQLANDISFGISTLRARAAKEKAEKAQRESEKRYQTLVESSPIGIGIQRDYKWVYVNPAAVRIYNARKAEDILNKPVNAVDNLSEREREIIVERTNQIISGAILEPYEFKTVFPDGREVFVQTNSVPIVYEGKPAILTLLKEVTREKVAERSLQNSREELRRLAAHLQAAREEERTYIAREIHDELGQYLTGLKMDISFLEDLVNDNSELSNKEQLLDKIASASSLIDTTVKSVRKIASELRPVILDSMGLEAAIEWLADDFRARSGIPCECFLTVSEIKLGRDKSTAVFRILQESLTNIMRHANATRVTVSFIEEGSNYLMEIKDNGKGITEEDFKKAKSFGLLGMKERAYLFGGTTEFESKPGKGTTVSVQIPFK
ncbi:MAG: PAS domain S-box protein [Ignavibacteria bacterium]|jgi:PAS domain S-box-containing protein|nr:PAS domain S-box protein [Ignavibacteria bacterium]